MSMNFFNQLQIFNYELRIIRHILFSLIKRADL